ncbi:hypothetical protein Tco_0353103 [Tanacetum coccineum]
MVYHFASGLSFWQRFTILPVVYHFGRGLPISQRFTNFDSGLSFGRGLSFASGLPISQRLNNFNNGLSFGRAFETILNMSPENKEHYQSKKEAIHLLLTGIRDEIYSTVDACKTYHDMWIAIERLQQEVNEICAERIAKNANPLALVVAAQQAVLLDGLHLDDKLHFVEEPLEIVGREVKRLKRSRIPLVKVRWNSKRGPEFTWEREDQFKKKYPHLFTKTTPSSSAAS